MVHYEGTSRLNHAGMTKNQHKTKKCQVVKSVVFKRLHAKEKYAFDR